MTTAIKTALANAERSYVAAKASTSQVSGDLFADAGGGALSTRTDLSQASEQLKHNCGWVYAAVNKISQKVAGQEIHVGRMPGRPSGAKCFQDADELDSHELLTLLRNPNDLQVAWSLMHSTTSSLELTGRSLWWVPDRKQIFPIPSSWIMNIRGSTSITHFVIRPPGVAEPIPLDAMECVYHSYPDPGNPKGSISPLQAMAASVDSDEAIQASQISMFQKGIFPSVALKVGSNPHDGVPGGVRPRLQPNQIRQLVNSIKKRYSGFAKSGEPLILDGLIEGVEKLSLTPQEMDWLSSSQVTKERILLGFGVNGIVLGQVEGANRASSVEASRHFIEHTINPKLTLLSATMTEWFARMYQDPSLVVWIEPAVANDAEMAIKKMELACKHQVVLADELRDFAGLPQDDQWANTLVGGKLSNSINMLDTIVSESVDRYQADREANRILDLMQPTPSGNGR
jgi:phage portal protein BeeE